MRRKYTGEAEFAGRWAMGIWRNWLLRTEQGHHYRLIFQGRRGGPAGPDFRDAILECTDGTRIRGDVELHLRPGGWYAHAHATDPRYNEVVLHVTPSTGTSGMVAVPLSNGRTAPQAALERALPPPLADAIPPLWPCEQLPSQMGQAGVRTLLQDAGWLRFARHAQAFEAELIEAGYATDRLSRDVGARVMAVALAEGLGFGRDRAALRSVGECLMSGEQPAALRDACKAWPHVERKRLEGLLLLWERWGSRGSWMVLDPLEGTPSPRAAAVSMIESLVVPPGLVSPGRAAILAASVVLPVADAWASLTSDRALGCSARATYAALPGLSSNQITREMMRQIGLPRLPVGAVAQQGLQHIWSTHCRDSAAQPALVIWRQPPQKGVRSLHQRADRSVD